MMTTATMQTTESDQHAGVSQRTGDCSGGNSICFSRGIVSPSFACWGWQPLAAPRRSAVCSLSFLFSSQTQ